MKHGYLIDMDGVLYRGHAPLPGVADLFAALELRDIPFRLATNNSTLTPHQYVEKLAAMHIDVDAEHIVTSGTATRQYLETLSCHESWSHEPGKNAGGVADRDVRACRATAR